MEWINVKEQLPKNEQEVLTFYKWDDDEPEIGILTYMEKGTVIGHKSDETIKNFEERLIESLKPENEIIAEVSGFYMYEDKDTMRKHADIITHWMPLPEPPKEEDYVSLEDLPNE